MWEHKRETIFCRKCGKKVVTQKARRVIFCSQKCANNYNRSGDNHHNWKGGIILKHGYRMIWHPHHPHPNKDGYVHEHRLVMEKHLGRFLDPKEVVHHENGNKTDNSLENLILFSNHSEHMKHHHPKGIKLQRHL